jgi:hypothetical protein
MFFLAGGKSDTERVGTELFELVKQRPEDTMARN